VTKVGSSNMTQRTGTLHSLHDRRKLAWAFQKSDNCHNYDHLVSRWITNIVLKSWTAWESGWFEIEWKLHTIGSFELHQNNASATIALSIREFLAKRCIPLRPQAHYSLFTADPTWTERLFNTRSVSNNDYNSVSEDTNYAPPQYVVFPRLPVFPCLRSK
jgi:hypothetical protein